MTDKPARPRKLILTGDVLRTIASYDPVTGLFVRNLSVSNIKKGSVIGCASKNGYLRGRINGTLYYIHRLAWLYVTGKWPDFDIDHKDGNVKNNAWENLREATRSENKENITKHSNSNSGIRNVYFDKNSCKWQVKIMKGYKSKSFGYFSTIEDASEAAIVAKRDLHKFQPEFIR